MKASFGSSTSFALCLAACFLHWSRLQRGDHNEFSMEEKGLIGASAMYCRKGTRSSMCLLDSSVGLCGNVAIIYELFGYLHHNKSTFPMPTMRILLVDSTVRQNKYDQIEHVARLKCLYPEFTNRCLDVIDEVSRNIIAMLELNDRFDILQDYVQSNQHMLYKLNLSNDKLNHIFYIAYVHGYRSVGKLTGIGEKKFAYILLRPGISEGEIDNISAHIESHNFPVTVTSISCDGVRIED
ncbi:Mevalonate kinase [Camponotus floridanus]|uniref:Mevalonate kinase n=2 Tax=Camponotus floridanus TaxID=104421 RepID=E2AW64_CAMFO|nr:Mevalonate kinase [Camponotus floridanus]